MEVIHLERFKRALKAQQTAAIYYLDSKPRSAREKTHDARAR
jgi:hypothetical protein